jgi:Icc-related predicted phosphoesterase
MKILAIGDPHGDLRRVKRIPISNPDVILLTGDLGKADLMRKMAFENIRRKKKGLPEKEFSPSEKKEAFMEAYDSTIEVVRYLSTFCPVYTIFGNVESSNAETRRHSKEIGLDLPFIYNDLNNMPNVKVINNRLVSFKGIRIGGLEYFVDDVWVKTFKPSNYSERLSDAKKNTRKAKKVLNWFGNLDILVCHQPPLGFLDKVTSDFAPKHWKGKHAGSKVILDYIRSKKPSYVFCGHIHEGEGMRRVGKTEIYNLGVGNYKLVEIN